MSNLIVSNSSVLIFKSQCSLSTGRTLSKLTYISHYVTILFWNMEATKEVEIVAIFMIIPASFSVEACAVLPILAAVFNLPVESYYSSR